MIQRIRQRIRKRPWMVPALLLVLVFAMGLLVETVRPFWGSAAKAGERFSDPPTNASEDYEDALGSTSSTRYNGRVWADKSVYTDDVTVGSSVEGGSTEKIEIGKDDFLISYSLMAATTVVEGQSLVPLDVVFVIDLSDSMKGDKIKETVVALNQSVRTLMMGNPDTRIGVVTYNNEAQVLLPLDHYTKVEGAENYFTLSETGDCLDVSVVNSSSQIISEAATMGQWTNIHMGIDAGMDLLLSVKDITTSSKEERYPVLMLMSDGAPTASGSDVTDWWQPTGMSGDGKVSQYGIDAMKSIMNAAYQKQQVSKHYGTEAKVYTVGVGVEQLNTDGPRETAKLTLNPTNELTSNNGYAKDLMKIWNDYQSGQSVSVGNDKRSYTFNHPDKDDEITSLFYNDAYFSATEPKDIAGVFQQVLNEIIVTGAVPTEVGSDPCHSGYITYVDPIGQYMEITDLKALVWKDNAYSVDHTITSGNTTTYIFKGRMTNPVYGQQEFSEIIITVTENPETNDHVLEMKVPAALIPLRTNYVKLNEDGTVKENVCDNNTPLQLFYSVSLRDEVVKTVDGKNYVNISSLSSEYVQSHTNADGSIRFHPNLYTGYSENQAGVDKTVGNAYVYFQAADTNPFYYNQTDTLLYSDETCTTPAKPGAATVFVKVPYYDGKETTFAAVERSTSYNPNDIITGSDGNLYLKAGACCNLSDRIMYKGTENNPSNTAETYRYPIYVEEDQKDLPPNVPQRPYGNTGETGDVLVYLGNNGVETLPVLTGDLSISKTVTGNMADEVDEKGQKFEFVVTMYYADGQLKPSPLGEETVAVPESTQAPETTVTPEPTEAPEVTMTPEPTKAPEVTMTPEPTKAPEVTMTPEPTEAPEVTMTPEPTEAPEVTVTPEPTEAPEATVAPEPTETPKATGAPKSTEVPEVAVTSEPAEVREVLVAPEVTQAPEATTTPEVTQPPAQSSNQRVFQAVFTDKDGNKENCEVTFTNGVAYLELMNGESITIQGLTEDYTYTVTELKVDPADVGIKIYDSKYAAYDVSALQNGRLVEWEKNQDYTCTGTIQYNQVETVDYTNELEVPIADITFTKVDGLDFNSEELTQITPLPGAEFRLYRYVGKSWETDKNQSMNPSSEYAIWKQMGDAVLSDENGVVTFAELQAGNYRLVETSAPDGYQLPDGQWNLTLTISREDSEYVGNIGKPEAVDRPPAFSQVDGIYYLMNYKPVNPPITGGDGGEDFRIGGGLLMFTGLVLATWWMWSSPRKRSEFL